MITWDKKFELGHEKIDSEHKIFLNLIIALEKYVNSHAPEQRVLLHLKELEQYAKFHFLSEENLMVDIGYPGSQKHKSEHQMLLSLLNDKVHDYMTGAIKLQVIVEFTYEWFALHTTQVDTHLVQYIRELESLD